MCPKVSTAHGLERRERILRAAAVCFCRRGFHRTTMQEICDKADLSKGGLYTYFKSKEEILAAVVEESFTASLQRAMAVARGGVTALEKLDRVAEAVIEGMTSGDLQAVQSPQLTLEIWAEASKNPHLNALCVRGYEQWRRFLADLLREGIAQGQFKSGVNPDALAAILVAVFDGLSLQEGITRAKVNWRQITQTLRQGLSEGIVAADATVRSLRSSDADRH